jgi:hypothetical protein
VTKTDVEGTYLFGGLATESKYSYEIATTYQEADYQSEQVTFAKDETTKSIDLQVYDSTAEDIIKVDVIHTLITPGAGTLKVEKYVTINNDTDKAYIGSKIIPADPTKKETIRFATSPGAPTFLMIPADGCCARVAMASSTGWPFFRES